MPAVTCGCSAGAAARPKTASSSSPVTWPPARGSNPRWTGSRPSCTSPAAPRATRTRPGTSYGQPHHRRDPHIWCTSRSLAPTASRSPLLAPDPSWWDLSANGRKRKYLPRGHRARAHDTRHVVQFAHDYREVARGERQRALIDGAAHLGQERVAYAGNTPAYHDH